MLLSCLQIFRPNAPYFQEDQLSFRAPSTGGNFPITEKSRAKK